MTKPYRLALHVFRRDLRLQDNTALSAALKLADLVIPCFILDKRQIERNEYKSDNCIQFMLNSLTQLDSDLQAAGGKLYLFHGIAEEMIEKLIVNSQIEAVFFNRDYTPFSIQRDQKIKKICDQHKVSCQIFADALLNEPEEVLKPNHEPYTVFTHFFNKAKQLHVKPAEKNSRHHYYSGSVPFADKSFFEKLLQKNNPNLLVKGGRIEALKLLNNIKKLAKYDTLRNFPAAPGTTHLSAHNKFGTISIREFYMKILASFSKQHTLIKELYWRDFFTHIAFHFPFVFGNSFHKKYASITWSKNETHFRAWREGRTGFPIIDAGMRELNTTGYMHNRVRMLVASFLTKDLHIDWRWGEKYFAQKLVDYDPAVNNGNWQWAASTGCDAQPYFRIFNPWLQQEKFDPDCLYIKKWIPELTAISPKIIHQLDRHKDPLFTNYPKPIILHAQESQKAKLIYSKA